MKKLLFSIAFFTVSFVSLNAQEISDHAIGLRLGDNGGLGGEISYQRKMKDTNRLELDLGLRDADGLSSYKLTGTYQWVWDLDELNENFNWYAGFGGGIGSWKDKALSNTNTVLLAAGIVGIEYSFEIPLMLSLDIRPEFGFNDAYDGLNSDIALSVRYKF